MVEIGLVQNRGGIQKHFLTVDSDGLHQSIPIGMM
jgi:hypothetical protein